MSAEEMEFSDQWAEFFRRYYKTEINELATSEDNSIYVDFADIYQFDPELANDLERHPEELLGIAEDVVAEFDTATDVELEGTNVRIADFSETTDIRQIRSEDVNNLIAVEGIVRKATDVRPKVEEAAFECQRCGTLTTVDQSGGEFSEPYECRGCERKGPFELLFDQSDFVDAQSLRIQESPEGLRGGQTPQNIDINIEDDLPGVVNPGDRVTATGVLRAVPDDESRTFDIFVEGVNVEIEEQDFKEFEITEDDRERILEIAESHDVHERIVESVAPTIYGYEVEKLAMVLQLFAGVTKNLPDGTRIRGDMHVLLIGDPGTGKSQLLQYIEKISPRGIYTSGKGATSAGLTAAAVQDDFGEGKWTLEAGALVLADKGIACVDELDKMEASDRSALHEALEQQQISVAKAGINATLKSRCSLLGAANPKYGRFDEYEGIAEQIDLEPALISRFDLIFTINDEIDEEADTRIAEHILESNYVGERSAAGDDVPEGEIEIQPEIDFELLRKYIAYARQHCAPRMTTEAREHIRDFYVDLRKGGEDNDTMPVTARKLEAIVRLAEASARVRLSDEVGVEDADRAIDIVQKSLEQVGVDPETGELDIDVIESGHSKSQRDRIKGLKEIIEDLADDDGKAPKEDILDAAEQNMERTKAEEQLQMLKRNGEILEPSPGYFRVT